MKTTKICMTDTELSALCFYAKQGVKQQIEFFEARNIKCDFEKALLELIQDIATLNYRTPNGYYKIEGLNI